MRDAVLFIIHYIYALLSCFYMFTIGALFQKNRKFIYDICVYFNYLAVKRRINGISMEGSVKTDIIPEIDLSKIISAGGAIDIRAPLTMEGNISLIELIVIDKLIKIYDPTKVFEIGTFDGRTALNLACNCRREGVLYTLDLPKEMSTLTKYRLLSNEYKCVYKDNSGSRFIGTDCEKKIVQLYGDSAVFDFSPYYNIIDFIFIDGSHAYEYVRNDSQKAITLLRNGTGVIVWHDYGTWDSVTKAVNELYLEGNVFRGIRSIKGTSLACLVVGMSMPT